MHEKSLRRLTFISVMLLGFVLVLVAQLVRWQVIAHFRLADQMGNICSNMEVIAPQRGLIKDRNGYLLAANSFQYNVIAYPNLIKNPQEVADRLWPLLGSSRQQLVEVLGGDGLYAPLKQGLPLEEGEAISDLGLGGISAEPQAKRVYPGETLAAHVLGFVNFGGDGLYGLEGQYDEILKGKPGKQELVPIGLGELMLPQNGRDLVLTIDRDIQFIVERELARGIEECGAEGGTVIVMEPSTGAILAMASYPTYDPNQPASALPELFINPAISEEYEPGSVFKIITVASGIEAGVISPETIFYDEGSIEIGGRTITNWDGKARGQVTLTDVLAHSLNVESVKISQALGAKRFYEYVRRFGFGQPTGVDLAGEVPGKLRLSSDRGWHEADLGANSFGQGIAVTPLQMVTAVAAVANDGLLLKPYVVQKVIGGEELTGPIEVRQAVSEATARKVTAMLAEAVKEEAPAAQVEGYSVAGKTGTAQIPGHGAYEEGATIASFVG
ncbi:MAG: penicillin-binding protein 2, partial [Chloroflexota bacterium]|nr:penicillin-binding protein 2 [Chloroflexota bacterium]